MQANDGQIQALRPSMQLLGRFRLALSGREIAAPGRKARGILAYLALAPGHSATREQLAGLLWSDRGPDQARASLRQSLKELRELSAIGETIATERDVVSLDVAALTIDLFEIRNAAATRDLAALAALLDEVRGDLVEDLADLSPAFDDWVQGERPRQHDLVVIDSLEGVEAGGLADMKDSRSVLRSLDRLDPVNEAVVRLGMRLDHASGDGASLHRRYRQLCDRLESEYGALPSGETRVLFHSLAAGRDEAAPPSIHARSEEVAPPGLTAVGCDLVPLVMVAPLQIGEGDGTLESLAGFAAADIRVSLSRMRGIQVLAVDQADVPGLLERCDNAVGIYLLSGSLRRFGAEYRAYFQLADAVSRIIVWTDSLRLGESEEAMLDAIVGKAAGAVIPAIDRDLNRRWQSFGGFPDEQTMYTRARLLIRSGGGLLSVEKGVQLLEAIVAANPQHLGAHLLLGRMYDSDFWQQLAGHDVARFRELAERHAQAAAAIEPGHYATRTRLAWRYVRKGNADAALRKFEAVLVHLSNDADVTNQCAMGFCFIGHLDKAEQLMQRAFFLNPFPPSDYHADVATVLALAGDSRRAEEHFAVSGETGVMYTAVRIANAAHLDGASDEWIVQLLTHFIAGFRRAWQPNRDPALSDVLEWAGYTLPLNRPEHMDWLMGGLRKMLEPCWPAALGNRQ